MATQTVDQAPPSDDDYTGVLHTYVPYKAGLPRLGPYVREVWRRREFLNEMSRANVRAGQRDTLFGKLWNILNPLLMGMVYFILVNILTDRGTKPGYFVYLVSGLFLFSVLQSCATQGSRSVVKAGKIITNTAFPRVLLPLSTVKTAVNEFIPSFAVLIVIAATSGVRFHPAQITLIPLFLLFTIFVSGIAMLLATIPVYFRDTASFLPFVLRIWLYGSPILWSASQVPASLKAIEILNPMYAIIGSWSDAIVYGKWPSTTSWIMASSWALVSFLVGAYVFLTRERDFAVRI